MPPGLHAFDSDIKTLNDIPLELLCIIAKYLGRNALLEFSLAFKLARPAAQHALFRHYENEPRTSSEVGIGKRFYLFARSICANPDLAKKVKTVDISWWSNEARLTVMDRPEALWWLLRHPCSYKPHTKAKRLASEVFIPGAITAGLTDQTELSLIPNFDVSPPPWTLTTTDRLHAFEFLNHLREGRDQALALLVIALLPNLSCLTIRDEQSMRTDRPLFHWPCILTRGLNAPTRLKSLVLRYPAKQRIVMTLDLLATFPALEVVDLHSIRIVQGNTTDLAQTNPNMLEMSLSHCTRNRATSACFTAACFSNFPGLINFDLVEFPMCSTDMDQTLHNLRRSHNTLRSLRLYSIVNGHAVGRLSECGMNSLVEFTELTTLSMASDFLFTYDDPGQPPESRIRSEWMNLPQSLEELCLMNSKRGIKAYLEVLIELRRDGRFPDLKDIVVEVQLGPDETRDYMEELEREMMGELIPPGLKLIII